MLKTVDVLIGLTVVMLLASLVVTVMTQFVTGVWNSRGKHLLKGVSDLLLQVAPGMDEKIAAKIAGAVLTHPMIRAVGGRYGDVVQRSELTKILLELAAEKGPQTIGQDARDCLVKAMQASGIADPAATLQSVSDVLLDLELNRPDLANNVRHNMALLQGAKSVFVARMNAWFDQTIDRVSDRFTFTTRGVTFVMAALLAVTLQLDTPLLVNRLAADPQLRSALVQQAVTLDAQNHQFDSLKPEERQQLISKLSLNELVSAPGSIAEWQANWRANGPHPNSTGVLLSAILLSFGAPFWYSALKNLLQLRSVLAQKDDQQRGQRESTGTKS